MELSTAQFVALQAALLDVEDDPGREPAQVTNYPPGGPDLAGVPDGVFRLHRSGWQYTVRGGEIVRACPRHALAFWHDDEVVIPAPDGELDDDGEDGEGDDEAEPGGAPS